MLGTRIKEQLVWNEVILFLGSHSKGNVLWVLLLSKGGMPEMMSLLDQKEVLI